MSQYVIGVSLRSRNARLRLQPRAEPYWQPLATGKQLGYYKGAKRGTWIARIRVDDLSAKERLGITDDAADADGEHILDYDQAIEKAGAWFEALLQRDDEQPDEPPPEPTVALPTVSDCVASYVTKRDVRQSARAGRPVKSDAHRLKGKIDRTSLGAISLDALSEVELQAWRDALPFKPSGCQRIVNDFKAALNDAFLTYRKLLPADFPNTVKFGLRSPASDAEEELHSGVRDNQILADPEVRAIITAAFAVDETGDLGRMVMLLAATGARFSQIARMKVRDVQAERSRVLVPSSRKGKKRVASFARVQVGKDVIMALQTAIDGREPDAPLLEHWRYVQIKATEWKRDYRGPWTAAAEITRPWQKILEKAALSKPVVPYALRHSSIVRGIREGLPIRLVAALHDTSVVMIERHYARWITEGLDELAASAVVPLLDLDAA